MYDRQVYMCVSPSSVPCLRRVRRAIHYLNLSSRIHTFAHRTPGMGEVPEESGVKTCSRYNAGRSKGHKNQREGTPSSHTWDSLNTMINNNCDG